jgi:hypothetical protein
VVTGVDMNLPKLTVARPGSFNICSSLLDKVLWGHPDKTKPSFCGLIEVPIVSSVAKVACAYDVLAVVAIRMILGKQMIFRKCEPVRERCLTVKAAITAHKAVSLHRFKGVTPECISELRHTTFSLFHIAEVVARYVPEQAAHQRVRFATPKGI